MAAPAVRTKLGGFSGGVAILWRNWVEISSVQADVGWVPFLRGRAIRAIWHSRWGPVGLTSVYGVIDSIDDNMSFLNTVLKDSLSLGCQVMVGGDFNTSFVALRHGVGAVSSSFTHLDFGPTCFSKGRQHPPLITCWCPRSLDGWGVAHRLWIPYWPHTGHWFGTWIPFWLKRRWGFVAS